VGHSPIFASDELLLKAPKARSTVADMDILRDEGIAYGENLKQAGVEVIVEVYEKAPHRIIGPYWVVVGLYGLRLDQI
jgi:acetyl esterase/lipase